MEEPVQGEVAAAETARDRNSKPWLEMLGEAKKCFATYHEKADKIDKLYADLEMHSKDSADREFQIFWANLEVLRPSIYSRPPVPVVTPRFKSRKPLPRAAADVLERSLVTDFEMDDIDATMRSVRDDLALNARGVAWVRYTNDGEKEQATAEHVDRADFLHGPARKWKEVPWVSRRSFLTRKQIEKRFSKTAGKILQQLTYEARSIGSDKDGDYKGEKKAEVWEIWHKGENAVVWVSGGVDEVLDIKEPFLQLEGFFPCPRPAYGTIQRSTMIPVPDFLYYKDQVEEINELTARISSLAESLRLKGFYAAGAGEVGEAVEVALKSLENNALLVPISNFAALGGTSLKDAIVWLPVKEVAEVIRELVALRRQLIEDVYEITGISDIMRGQSEASETLGAQQLKSQYGTIRIKDRQEEIIRIARDITRIKAEVMAENFQIQTLMEMSQVDDLPTEQAIAQQVQQIIQQAEAAAGQLMQNPEVMQMALQNPQQAEQVIQKAEAKVRQQIEQLKRTPTVEKVYSLLQEQRIRPFVLDIETDSTIQPDEDADKQRRTEFLTAIGSIIREAGPMVEQRPETGPFVASVLKFAAGGFRAGREMDTAIDEFAEQLKQVKPKQQGPSPEQIKAQADAQQQQAVMKMKNAEMGMKLREMQAKHQVEQQKAQADIEQARADLDKTQGEVQKIAAEIEKIRAETGARIIEAEAKANEPKQEPVN